MHEVYAFGAKRSFVVMGTPRDDGPMTVLHPLLHAALSVERDRDARAALRDGNRPVRPPRAVRSLRRLPRRLRP
jgi:hypothetical protein